MFSYLDLKELFGLRGSRSQIYRTPDRKRVPSRLALEELEKRLAPATHYWVGGIGNNTWSTAADWNDNELPGPGDTLIFDSQAKTDSNMDAAFGNQIPRIVEG